MPKREYFERHGPTPLDAVPEAERIPVVTGWEHCIFVRLVQEHHGGRVIVSGLGRPEVIEKLMDYRIGIRGLGDGRVEIWLDRPDG